MTYLSFPRQHARTQRFTLGAPRSFAVAPDGKRVVFVRSRSGTERTQLLWVLDVAAGGAAGGPASGPASDPADTDGERIVADPVALLGGGDEELSAAERARRERSREGSAGVVGYAVDSAVELAAFALSGRLFVAGLRAGLGAPEALDTPDTGAADGVSGATDIKGTAGATGARELTVPGPVVDPRPSPDGRHVAYASGGALRVVETTGKSDRAIVTPDGESVTWGLAEFVAAEEMSRTRGFWWSPDSTALLVARVDESPVQRWWIAEPAHPDRAPVEVAYPAAGTPNADVSLALFGLDGSRVDVTWDRERFPYLAVVHWSASGPPLLLVQARDQREQRYLAVDTATGATETVQTEEDRIWLDLFPGVPVRTPSGELVRITDEGDVRVLKVGEKTLTDGELHVRAVLDAGGGRGPASPDSPASAELPDSPETPAGSELPAGSEIDVLVSASAGRRAADPEIGEVHVYRVTAAGAVRISERPGVHTAVRGAGLTVLTSTGLDFPGARTRVLRGGVPVAEIASYAEVPSVTARPRLLETSTRRIPTAVLLPTGYAEGDGPLPVLLDPYGGPHGQRVYAAHNAHTQSQWFADQGFAVIVADGR
ncbi:MAG: dipeptidyl-peptidase 4, partial [Streptomyces sp.]|nr:dipeptidyl-peptidase 4 [Streptomyces sp.]